MKKRSNGSGSIFKNNSTGKWCVKITVGWENGKQKMKQLGSFSTKREAVNCLNMYNENSNFDFTQKTIGDILTEWFAKYKLSHNPKSIRVYDLVIKSLFPLYNIKVCDITYQQLQDYADTVTTSQCHVKTILHSLFKEIQKNTNITDYSKLLTFPKNQQKQKEKVIFSEEDINFLWKQQGAEIYDITLILLYSGMRITELLEMTNENIHLDKRYMTGGLKTDAGRNRIIPICEKIVPIIERYYNKDNLFLISHGVKKKPRSYISVYKIFNEIVCPNVTEGLTIHSTRHTFTTNMARAGVNLFTIKRIIGHAIGDVTEGVYVHNDINELREAVNKL